MYTNQQLGLDEPATYDDMRDRNTALAAAARERGDPVEEGLGLARAAWALEKQGNSALALEYVARARPLLRNAPEEWWRDDWWRYAELCHTTAVWKFHNIDLTAPPTDDFLEAAEVRRAHGDALGTAQSWHNLAYTQLMLGWYDDAIASYDRAAEFLHDIATGSDEKTAAIADREQGFLLSHLAFAFARHGSVGDALKATEDYFKHVARTGVHREPVLAYVAPGVALSRSSNVSVRQASGLIALTGIRLYAEPWLRRAVQEAADAMVSQPINPNTGLGAYLGSYALALVELSKWCSAKNSVEEAERHATEALNLSLARGWHGEAARVRRAVGLTDLSRTPV